jgi:hypothetical protein
VRKRTVKRKNPPRFRGYQISRAIGRPTTESPVTEQCDTKEQAQGKLYDYVCRTEPFNKSRRELLYSECFVKEEKAL